MELALHTIKPGKQAGKDKKRLGRGNSSGRGNYSTRGIKGQRARSGGKRGLKKLGLKPLVLATPKQKGFKSIHPKNQIVSLEDLNIFQEGETITKELLLKKNLIDDTKKPVKLLSNGELKVKNLKIQGIKASKTAQEQIEKLGGIIK